MKRFNKYQKITVLALIGFGLFNPFTVAVLENWFKLVYTGIFVGCAGWIAGYVLYNALKPEVVKVAPKKKNKRDGLKYEVV